MSMRFQNWLFDQGAVIRQKNKKLYLEFADPGDAITFKFKYCIR